MQSYDSAPRPPLTHSPPVSKLSLFLRLSLCSRIHLADGRGAGVEPNHTTVRQHGPLLIVQCILSDTAARRKETKVPDL